MLPSKREQRVLQRSRRPMGCCAFHRHNSPKTKPSSFLWEKKERNQVAGWVCPREIAGWVTADLLSVKIHNNAHFINRSFLAPPRSRGRPCRHQCTAVRLNAAFTAKLWPRGGNAPDRQQPDRLCALSFHMPVVQPPHIEQHQISCQIWIMKKVLKIQHITLFVTI